MDQENKNDKGIDLSGAAKDSNAGVKFQEKGFERAFFPGTPKIIQWTIKYSGGLIKDEKQANYVLLGFAAAAIIVSLFLFFGNRGKKTMPLPASYIDQRQFLPNQ